MLDFRRATVFSLGYRFSKHKMTKTIGSKNLEMTWPSKTHCFMLHEKKHE